jgi:hypothetical protein
MIEFHLGDCVVVHGGHIGVVTRELGDNHLVWVDCLTCGWKLALKPEHLTLVRTAPPAHVHDWWKAVLLDKGTELPTIHDFWMCPSCGATSPGPTDNEALDPRAHPSSSVHQGGKRDVKEEGREAGVRA